LVKEEIAQLHQGLERLLEQMEHTPEEYKTEEYAPYTELMETFLDNAAVQHQQIQTEWDNFEPHMNNLIASFPDTPDGSLQVLFGAIFQFGKKFRDIIEQRRREQEEYEKFAQMGWIGGEIVPIPEENTSEQKPKVPRKLGILDQLIEGVIRGDYGLNDDNVPQFYYHENARPPKATVTKQRVKAQVPALASAQASVQVPALASAQAPAQAPAQQEEDPLDQIDAILDKIDDFGFGSSYADDLGAFGGEEDGNLGGGGVGMEDDLDALLGDGGDFAGFTIDQLLG